MLMEKVYCCECGEDTEYDQGREIWESELHEGKYGHRFCVEKYDKKIKKKMASEDEYETPSCSKCDSDLIVSRTFSIEQGYRLNEYGEIISRPIEIRKNFGDPNERLFCERCKLYFDMDKDKKGRIIIKRSFHT